MISDWAENVAGAAREAICQALATSESLASFTDAVFPNGTWDNQVATGIRRGFCGNPTGGPDPSDFPPAITAQCADTQYFMRSRIVREPGNPTQFVDRTFYGPLSIDLNPGTGLGGTINVFGFNLPTSNPSRQQINLRNASFADGGTAFLEVQTLTPLNGPDNCGSIQGVPKYQPQTINKTVNYIDNSQQQVTENYDFTINVPVIIGGILIAPVTVAGNNFTVELSVPINGDINFNFGQGRSGDTQTENEPGNSPIDEPPDSETERRIIAVLVTATVDPNEYQGQVINQQGNPTIYGPRLGNVSFYVSAGNAAGWTSDIPIKNVRNYIRCPVPQGAINVQATADKGVTLQLTRVYSSQESLRSQIGA